MQTVRSTHFNKYIERAVVCVPSMCYLALSRRGGHVEKDLEPGRPLEVLRQFSGDHRLVGLRALPCQRRLHTSCKAKKENKISQVDNQPGKHLPKEQCLIVTACTTASESYFKKTKKTYILPDTF